MKLDFIKSGAGRVFLPALVLSLSACGGGGSAPTVLTPEQEAIKDQIEARRHNFHDLGAAFKAVGDEIREGRPTSPTVIFSIQAVRGFSNDMGSWFQEGTGPDSGFETDSLASVWSDADGFAAQMASFRTVVQDFAAAAQANDGDAITSNFRIVGQACQECHDRFREEE